jgi:hypothetical protein
VDQTNIRIKAKNLTIATFIDKIHLIHALILLVIPMVLITNQTLFLEVEIQVDAIKNKAVSLYKDEDALAILLSVEVVLLKSIIVKTTIIKLHGIKLK